MITSKKLEQIINKDAEFLQHKLQRHGSDEHYGKIAGYLGELNEIQSKGDLTVDLEIYKQFVQKLLEDKVLCPDKTPFETKKDAIFRDIFDTTVVFDKQTSIRSYFRKRARTLEESLSMIAESGPAAKK